MTAPGDQVDDLLSMICVLTAGTCTVTANQDGAPIPGLEAVDVSDVSTGRVAPSTYPTPVADLDAFSITVADLVGTSADTFLSVDFEFGITP